MNELVASVKELRSRLNVSQQVFANRLGISARAVANYEAGRTPTRGVLFSLAMLAGQIALEGLTAVSQAGAEVWFYGWHPRLAEFGTEPGRYCFDELEYCYGGSIASFSEFHRRISELEVAVAPLVDREHNRSEPARIAPQRERSRPARRKSA